MVRLSLHPALYSVFISVFRPISGTFTDGRDVWRWRGVQERRKRSGCVRVSKNLGFMVLNADKECVLT